MSIVLQKVSHEYATEYTKEKVLDDINMEFQNGKMYAITGPSGSGKSTLLNIMGGLLKPSEGSVWVNGENISSYSERQLANLRVNKVGYIFQNFNLVPFLDVKENILLQLRISKKEIKRYEETYNKLLKILGLIDKEKAYMHQLSGGEQQRVAIARCLLAEPEIILADEPTGNLDLRNTNNFMELIKTIMKEIETTFIVVTHDNRVSSYCDITFNLEGGKLKKDKIL